jgi:hypothetical protein
MWIWVVSDADGGSLSRIAATARTYGTKTLIVKSSDGANMWSQFTPALVHTMHAAGLRVCAWQYVYGDHPIWEADLGAEAVKDGADCLVIDAEVEYDGRYEEAQVYMRRLRKLIGYRFPVALAGLPYVDYHPAFPYSVFLGLGGAQYNMPQMYWADIGTTVDDVYTHTYLFNRPYDRPIFPLGQAYENPPARAIRRFRQVSEAYGAAGVSWWDWQDATLGNWRALSQPLGRIRFTPTAGMATLGLGAAGDLVVWAQEHLVSAGARIAIDGAFGPLTKRALERFQSAHGLSPSGLIDTDTWDALLRYRAAHVVWTRRQTATVAATRRGLTPLPENASLPDKRDEIAGAGGAGYPPAH